MKRFYIIQNVDGHTIAYGDEEMPLTRENLDRVIAEVKAQPNPPEIKLSANIEKLLTE